jgi:P27 family predicted phage terminase small subunit
MKTSLQPPDPPKALSIEARAFWRQMHREFDLGDSHAHRLLLTACECLDRMRAAQSDLQRDGLTVRNSRGELRAHPSAAIERDSRIGMLQALRALHIDHEPLAPTPGRQPGR